MIELRFNPWRVFSANFDRNQIRRWMMLVAKDAQSEFKKQVLTTKSGRVYVKTGGRRHIASRAGEFPASDTGNLVASAKIKYGRASATLGNTAPYAGFLATGTRRMAPRQMSRDALRIASKRQEHNARGAIKFVRGNAPVRRLEID